MRNWCRACNGPSFQSLVCLIGGSQKIYFLAQWRLASADQKYGLLAGPDFINPGAARRGRLNKIGWNRGHEARRSLGLGISNRPEKWGMSRYASAGDRSIAALLRGYFSGTPVSRLKFFTRRRAAALVSAIRERPHSADQGRYVESIFEEG
jgi:hypothetical protein